MKFLDLVKDGYDRQARLAPALIVLFPPAIVTWATSPALRTTGPGVLSIAVACGFLIWLTQFGRDRGKRAEPGLFNFWGGSPSVALLRHRDKTLPKLQKKRYHGVLGQRLGEPMPTEIEEALDAGAADECYQAAVSWLIAQTRDKTIFGLLWEENVNYGFRRNLWALRSVAICFGVLSLALAIYEANREYQALGAPSTLTQLAIGAIIAYLSAMLLLVNREWVRIPATAYAQRLLEACDRLPAPPN